MDVTDAFIAFHQGSAWANLNRFFTGFHLQDFRVTEVSRDYRTLINRFVKSDMFEKKGHGVIYSLCFISVLLAACVYSVLYSDSFAVHMASGALLGLAWMQLAQILTGNCFTGISIAWWKWTHNAHHVGCNSLDHDPNLEHLPVLAVSSRLFSSITSRLYNRKLSFHPLGHLLVSYLLSQRKWGCAHSF
ncbi:Delta(8)-fatty-acid desaturase 1 [Striga hermonthica]|uniref:Delta(8)-fatty-acid desaturase 1 n=1 Tax=Striga hermonthica TaxID=68872 RepID=A0A9N7NFA3_STRHE|nr:Delta(8)-fatty-acid desaturase 1 [Striga hermonthica]